MVPGTNLNMNTCVI